MKNIIALSLICLLLSGCLGSQESPAVQPIPDESFSMYDNPEFSIAFPKDWDVMNKDEFTSDIPEVTVVVFRDNVKNEKFTPNVNVVRHILQEPSDSVDYAKLVFNRQSSGLVDFKEISKIERDIVIGKQNGKSTFLVFEARILAGEPLIKYVQTYAVKGNLAYIITGSFLPNETQNTVQKIENIIKSFSLK